MAALPCSVLLRSLSRPARAALAVSRPILSDVALTFVPGRLTAIVGPNGSGKTTLLRALTGEIAAEGRITLDGIAVTPGGAAALAARRGVLPQASAVAFPFTVAEVVRIGHLAGRFADRPDVPLRALDRVGLRHLAGRFLGDLSGGEQQHVHLARVLAQIWAPVGPDGANWLFLDEPVASLDIGQQLGVMRLARDYAAEGGGVAAVMLAGAGELAANHGDTLTEDLRIVRGRTHEKFAWMLRGHLA